MRLTAENVEKTFFECLGSENDKFTQGVELKAMFKTNKLEEQRLNIREMLNELPMNFMQSGGQGWSFLNMCVDKNGNQWTGSHEIVDKLVCLGIASGYANFVLPRGMWKILPGGMPYIAIDDSRF